jgi:peptidoglycan hydrolase-like protein with peptidoglycan-binding domain
MGFTSISAGLRHAEDMVPQMMRGENEQIPQLQPGKVDGIVGGLTRTAIAAFTAKHRLRATRDYKDLLAAIGNRLDGVIQPIRSDLSSMVNRSHWRLIW